MVMNAFDTDGDGENNFYAVNGPAFYYARYPIKVKRSQTVRIYIANLTEFDLVNSFHLHGDFFRYYPTGTSDRFEYTDTIMLCQGERGIIEIDFANTGRFMFHAHQSEFAETSAGWASSRYPTSGSQVGRRGKAPSRAPALAAVGARPDRPARRRRLALLRPRGSLIEPRGREPAPRGRLRHPPRRVLARRDLHPRDEPPARGSDDRDRHGRRCDRPLHRRWADHPRPPALGHDRRRLRLGGGRADRGGRHEPRPASRRRRRSPRPSRRRSRARAASSATRSSAPWSASSPWRSACSAPLASARAPEWLAAFMALTGGLLTFLAVEALAEALELQAVLPGALGGTGLVVLGVAASYLALTFLSQRLSAKGRRERGRARRTRPGDARGHRHRRPQPRRGARGGDVVRSGRAYAWHVPHRRLHAPQHHRGARHRGPGGGGRPAGLGRLAALVLIAGAPTILGAWIGGYVTSDVLAVLFFSVAAGRRAAGRRGGNPLRRAAGAGRPHVGLRRGWFPRRAGDHVRHRPARRVGNDV